MRIILGIIILFSCILGGFVLAKGHILALWQPNELLIIGGGATGAFIIANPMNVVRAALSQILGLILGQSKCKKEDYLELLHLLFKIGTQVRRKGLMNIEDDIDAPEQSPLFQSCPSIYKNPRVLDFITDGFRIILSGNLSGFEVENILDNELEAIEEELVKPAQAVNTISDSLPGFGIVAAVMGIVITMQFLGNDPSVLGTKVAAALVGTFLGVLLCYGVVGPVATAMKNQIHKELLFYHCFKTFLTTFISGTSPIMAAEYARRSLSPDVKPSFIELDEALRSKNAE